MSAGFDSSMLLDDGIRSEQASVPGIQGVEAPHKLPAKSRLQRLGMVLSNILP